MNRTVNVSLSIIMALLDAVAQFTPILPDKYKPYAIGSHILLEAIKAQIAHVYNPNGTPAEVPWEQPKP